MGIVASSARLYLEARRRGVAFSHTLTIGRQRLYLTERQIRNLAEAYGIPKPASQELQYAREADGFFHQFLGVRELKSLDGSPYEGASIIHDMNLPVPPGLERAFDVVIDAGSLEHIFNFPMAVANCMKMVKPGGTLFITSPANNHCGHGFYQFSPELFFRLFKDRNGFALRRLVLVTHPFPGAELSPCQDWYEVSDPADVGGRVSLVNDRPVQIMMEATRTSIAPILAEYPQQSDYISTWARAASRLDTADASPPTRTATRRPARALLRALYDRLPARLQHLLLGYYQRGIVSTLRNRRFFRRVSSPR